MKAQQREFDCFVNEKITVNIFIVNSNGVCASGNVLYVIHMLSRDRLRSVRPINTRSYIIFEVHILCAMQIHKFV